MEADSFIFCQDELPNSSFSAFKDMKANGELIDFKVTIQNRCFFAHRLVLAAGIPYLRKMFTESANEIPLEGIDPEIFGDVINFAYCGKITITAGNVQSLLVTSQYLQLTKVHDACLKYMAVRISTDNVFQIRSFAGNIQSLRLAATCDRFILRNFEAFVFSHLNEFLQLPFLYLREIISRDDLNVVNEEKVFEAVLKWVRASSPDRHTSLPELLCCVRMTRLPPHYLVEKVSTEELVMTSVPCRYLVEETKNYHLLMKKPSSFLGAAQGYPRNTIYHGLYAICSSTLGSFVELYDVDKEVWITLANIGSGEIKHAVGFNGKLYFFENFSDKIRTFDAKTLKKESLNEPKDSWSPGKLLNQIVLHDKKFYAFTDLSRILFSFDPKLKQWLELKTITDSSGSGIASMGDYIYITGGLVNRLATKISMRYNPSTGKHSEISSMLVARWRHGCAGLNGKLYVCGGVNCTQFETAEMYDPLVDHWSFIARMKSTLREISAAAYKGKIYAFGDGTMEIFDPAHGEWKLGAPVPSSCKFIKLTTIPFAGDEKACPEFSTLQLQR